MKAAVRFVLGCLFVGVTLFTTAAYAADTHGTEGAVFVLTNALSNNEVVAYDRNADGTLAQAGTFATGGSGSGGTVDPLTSQGALQLSREHHLLFAVNAGSSTITSFAVHGSTLKQLQVVSSGGSFPVAIAQAGHLLYVLNTGGDGNINGFHITEDGLLRPIANSSRNLSSTESGASSLAFSPDRQFLVVTERKTNVIDVFRVLPDGTLSAISVDPSAGAVPFAAEFAPNGALIVAELGGSISSYAVLPNQQLSVITASLPTDGKATCWNVITPNGRFVYTSNAASSSLSGYGIGRFGVLTPIGATVVANNPAGSINLNVAVSKDGRFLYTLNTGSGAIGIFAIDGSGYLSDLGVVDGLPAASGLNGLAAY